MGQVHATTARGGPAAGIPTCTATGRAGAIATGAGAHDARGRSAHFPRFMVHEKHRVFQEELWEYMTIMWAFVDWCVIHFSRNSRKNGPWLLWLTVVGVLLTWRFLALKPRELCQIDARPPWQLFDTSGLSLMRNRKSRFHASCLVDKAALCSDA